MLYKSEAQRKFFHANKESLAKQGINVEAWDKASEGKKLPERVGKPKAKGYTQEALDKAFKKISKKY